MAAKAVDARERLSQNRRFRGHGPLLQGHRPLRNGWRCHGGIYKGSSPCWYAKRPSRRGPSAREAAMGRSYKGIARSAMGGTATGDIQGVLPLLVRQAAKPPRAIGPRGGHGPLLQTTPLRPA